MTLDELKKQFDKAYSVGQTEREEAVNDLVFYWVTQWDDSVLGSTLDYRGEFNILRKAGRQIMAELDANPVSIDFDPADESREDGAELLDGIYRARGRGNDSIEAFRNAKMESVVCGMGAWRLHHNYVSLRNGDEIQEIFREPIHEAVSKVFFDPDAKLSDKSDAKYVFVLHGYTEDGYKDYVEELTGERPEKIDGSFSHPEQNEYSFRWFDDSGETVYVVEAYHIEMVKDKVVTMSDPFDNGLQVLASRLEEHMDMLIDAGYSVVSEKEIKRKQVVKCIASGDRILTTETIAGEHLPIVPIYGERAYVNGCEHFEGITRLAKDPQRLRNFQLSYLADIVGKSPRRKPIFFPEQVAGFESMYEENGADNNYPYYLQNRFDANGRELPLGPPGEMPETPLPQALIASIELARQAVEDVANAGLPQNIADPDLSGKAVLALQNRIDMQSVCYQEGHKHALRRDAEIFASMATEIYDAPRTVTIAKQDGSREKVKILETVIDKETGEVKVINDLTNMEFSVYADIGLSYTSRKQQTREELSTMIPLLGPQDTIRNALLLQYIMLLDGSEYQYLRDYANRQLILQGFKEPESDEEREQLEAAMQQQGQQVDPNILIGQAEMLKGQAAMMREQNAAAKMQADVQNAAAKTQIDAFRAQTDFANMQINAQKVGADIQFKRADALTKRMQTGANRLRGSLQ